MATSGHFAALNGHALSSVEFRIPEIGIWTADVALSDPPSGAAFGLVTLTLAGLSAVGTVYRGGMWHGTYRALVVGGKGGWQKEVPAKGYGPVSALKASLVLKDAARECGETIELAAADDWVVGQYWDRARAPAGRVLTLLGRPWYIRAVDGITVVKARDTGAVGAAFDTIDGDPSQGRFVIATEAPEAFVPGKRLVNATLSEATIRSVIHRASGRELRSEIWT